jgi:Flp pilus assembly protein TadD
MAAIGVGLAGGDITGAVDLVDRSLALNASSAEALTYSGMLRAYLGDCDTALEHIARSTRLSPIDAQTYNKFTAAAFAHFMCGRLDAAWEASERALSYKHDYEPPLRMRTACLGLLGRDAEARAAAAKLLAVSPNETLASVRAYYQQPFKVAGSCERLLEGFTRAELPSGN